MSKILVNSLINEGTAKMSQWLQKENPRSKDTHKHLFTYRYKTGQQDHNQLHSTSAFQWARIICTIGLLKQFSELLNSSKIVKSRGYSAECYGQNIQ